MHHFYNLQHPWGPAKTPMGIKTSCFHAVSPALTLRSRMEFPTKSEWMGAALLPLMTWVCHGNSRRNGWVILGFRWHLSPKKQTLVFSCWKMMFSKTNSPPSPNPKKRPCWRRRKGLFNVASQNYKQLIDRLRQLPPQKWPKNSDTKRRCQRFCYCWWWCSVAKVNPISFLLSAMTIRWSDQLEVLLRWVYRHKLGDWNPESVHKCNICKHQEKGISTQ